MTDVDLPARSAKGDETAFELLYLTLNRKAADFDATRAQLRTWRRDASHTEHGPSRSGF